MGRGQGFPGGPPGQVGLQVAFRRPARLEFEEAAAWYEARRRGLGAVFRTEIDRAVRHAAETPQRFPLMHRNVHCIRVRRFPYSIFFVVEAERIVILAIFHARRDPHRWTTRG